MLHDDVVETLANGGLVVMRSDTIYGIFASALNKSAVEKLYELRERDQKRGFIILVDSVKTVMRLIEISDEIQKRLAAIWRADSSTSVILSAKNLKEIWLADTRESDPTICFRVPNNEKLRKLLAKTGPLCAPSVNPPGQEPAHNISEAKAYFGDTVDLYVDGGECDDVLPSRIIKLKDNGEIEVVRSDGRSHPEDFVITRRRKLYKFACFDEYKTCFHLEEWVKLQDRVLQGNAELVVEIGAGSALFSVELARRHKDKTFIAVDIKGDRLYQGAREAEKLGLKNIYFVRSDIARITDVIPLNSASEIWITFPDPHANEDQTRLTSTGAKHRLTAPRYLNLYKQILVQNGILHFKTDNLPLFDWTVTQLSNENWKIDQLTRDLHISDLPDEYKIMTNYEKRFVAEGRVIYYLDAKL